MWFRLAALAAVLLLLPGDSCVMAAPLPAAAHCGMHRLPSSRQKPCCLAATFRFAAPSAATPAPVAVVLPVARGSGGAGARKLREPRSAPVLRPPPGAALTLRI